MLAIQAISTRFICSGSRRAPVDPRRAFIIVCPPRTHAATVQTPRVLRCWSRAGAAGRAGHRSTCARSPPTARWSTSTSSRTRCQHGASELPPIMLLAQLLKADIPSGYKGVVVSNNKVKPYQAHRRRCGVAASRCTWADSPRPRRGGAGFCTGGSGEVELPGRCSGQSWTAVSVVQARA